MTAKYFKFPNYTSKLYIIYFWLFSFSIKTSKFHWSWEKGRDNQRGAAFPGMSLERGSGDGTEGDETVVQTVRAPPVWLAHTDVASGLHELLGVTWKGSWPACMRSYHHYLSIISMSSASNMRGDRFARLPWKNYKNIIFSRFCHKTNFYERFLH